MIGLLMAWAVVGTEGIPIPYSPRMDDGITVVLLCCFFLSAYVLSRSRKFLLQLVKDFLLHRERTSIFATSTAADMRYLLLLILQTCILAGVCIFNYFNDIQPELVHHVPPGLLLGIYIGMCLLYLCLKWMLYSFLGWIFFEKGNKSSFGMVFAEMNFEDGIFEPDEEYTSDYEIGISLNFASIMEE